MQLHRPRTAVLTLATLAAFSVADASCAPTLSLEDRKCPCIADYHCCESIGICRPNGVACPAGAGAGGNTASQDAGSGGTNAGGAGAMSSGGAFAASGGGANAGGAAASMNASDSSAGASGGLSNSGGAGSSTDGGPPTWRSLDAPGLAPYEVRDTCDLELDSNGTPFVAFRSCHACTSTLAVPPVVLTYDGTEWQSLPSQGLPSTTIHAPLVVSSDGKPHLLVDQAVLSFDGATWTEQVPRVPAGLTPDRNFELDASDQFAVTTFDAALAQISVLRFEVTAWRTLGAAIASNSAGERLTRGGSDLWLAHSDGAGSFPGGKIQVRHFDGAAWPIAGELDLMTSFEVAVTTSGTIYVARQMGTNAPVSVTEGQQGSAWNEILNIKMFATPNLRVGPDGALYAAELMDGFVNLSTWDGSQWIDWDQPGLTASQVPALRIAERSRRRVPFLCFTSGTRLIVMKYE